MPYEMRPLCTSLFLNAFKHNFQFILLITYHICKANSGEQVSLKINRIDRCGGVGVGGVGVVVGGVGAGVGGSGGVSVRVGVVVVVVGGGGDLLHGAESFLRS